MDSEPFLHAHVTLAGRGFEVRGGHLFDATMGVVAELVAEPLTRPLAREPWHAQKLTRWAL